MPATAAETPVLRSPLLSAIGVPHAFSTRIGGVSAGLFSSLNFGNPSDLAREERDPPEHIRENYARLLAAAGCPGRELVEVHQVHGSAVHVVRAGSPAHPPGGDTRADAIVTDDPARVLAVRIADCAPVLLASEDGRVVAAVHAGWRGVVTGVLVEAVRAMCELGASGVRGAAGPCIGRDYFEVGPEVAAEFRRIFGAAAPIRPGIGDRSMVDLKAALAIQARGAAVDLDVLPHCTFADASLFFSHRRDRGRTGRMAAVIAARI